MRDSTEFFGNLVSNVGLCRKRTHILRVIGQFVAKAMLDSRIIDLSFNKIFLKLVLGEDVPLTIATLKVSFLIVDTKDSILTVAPAC